MSPHNRPCRSNEIDIDARDAHVLQVLDVDGRDAAQRGVREVQRCAARRVDGRHQRCGRVVDVRDEPQPALLVQRPRLRRDVGGRVVQAEERVEVLALGLGDDLAVVVLVVAVHHHAVEAGEVTDRTRGGVVQLGQRGGPVQLLHRAAHRLVGVREGERALAVGDLEFDQEHTSGSRCRMASNARGWPATSITHSSGLRWRRSPKVDAACSTRAACSAPISADRCRPKTASTGRPSSSATLALTCRTSKSGSRTTASTPRGWMLPGMWIGSRAQLSRSIGVPTGTRSGGGFQPG